MGRHGFGGVVLGSDFYFTGGAIRCGGGSGGGTDAWMVFSRGEKGTVSMELNEAAS